MMGAKDSTILVGDCRELMATLPGGSVQSCVTSPPYWGLRDYGVEGQLGLEDTPEEYVANLVEVFRAVRRMLRDDGTLWLNLGDSYAGSGPSGASYQSETTKRRATQKADGNFRISKTLGDRGLTYAEKKPVPPPGLKSKDLVGIPWRVAFALQADGWWLRSDVIWAKPNPMPESVTDRPTKAHEYLFLLTKSARYFYNADAIKEPAAVGANGSRFDTGKTGAVQGDMQSGYRDANGRNKRSVWTVTTQPYPGAHFAVMPKKLVEPCVLAGSRVGDTVLDPFAGTATVGIVALQHGRRFVGCELKPEYAAMAEARIATEAGQSMLFTPSGDLAK